MWLEVEVGHDPKDPEPTPFQLSFQWWQHLQGRLVLPRVAANPNPRAASSPPPPQFYQVPETLPKEVLEKMGAPPKVRRAPLPTTLRPPRPLSARETTLLTPLALALLSLAAARATTPC